MNFVPRNMRTSHCVYQSSDDRNRCLYNSVSLLLYGSDSHSAFLKLLSTLKGFSEVEKIKEEVRELFCLKYLVLD